VVQNGSEQKTQESEPAPGLSPDPAWTDSQLLEAFVRRRDEMAFTTLVRRHSQMVWQICRRYLFGIHDAEDAFQATFVVLAQRAPQIGRRELLANWLYGVAQRVARRAQAVASRRHQREGQSLEMAERAAAAPQIDPNLKRVVHEEVNHLPAKYRAPVLLCYLENRTHEEAAHELQCPLGTVKGRLSRALETLRTRLVRRGLALSAGTVAVALSQSATEAAVPAALVADTAQLGARLTGGTGTGADVLPAKLATLTKGIGAAAVLPKAGWLACGLLGLLAIGGVIYWFSGSDEAPVSAGGPARSAPLPPADDKTLLQGAWIQVSVQVDGVEIPHNQEDFQFVFSGNRLLARLHGQDRAEYAFALQSDQKPKAIDITLVTMPPKGKVLNAVYELNGDVLKLCFPGNDSKRPPEVASRPETGIVLITLHRQPK
jgi:RNA polymerase sigma-70 factor (ECF subfamily)